MFALFGGGKNKLKFVFPGLAVHSARYNWLELHGLGF
jgi:hypothetical protein